MKLWLVMLSGGFLTFLIRWSFIALSGRVQFPAWLRRSLRFVPPAVLSAIIFQEILVRSGELDLSLGNERLLAGIVACLVGWKTRNTLLTIAAGMVSLLIIQVF